MKSKYMIFAVIFFGYAVYGYNRKGVSLAVPKLLQDGIKKEDIGVILSAQNLAYAISKFLGGIISDKLSSRVLFSIGLFVSGLAAIIFPMVDTVNDFALVWFLNGLAQGVGWPAIAKLLKNWFDPTELGTWWSAASASANLSGCVAPFIASYIISNYGWRFSLTFCGSLTIASAAIAYLFLIDSPRKAAASATGRSPPKKPDTEGKKSESPKKHKSESKEADRRKPRRPHAIIYLVGKKVVWIVSICYLIVSSIKTTLTDWSPSYLMNDCGQSQLAASSFVSSVEFGGFIGGIAAGIVSDLYSKDQTSISRVSHMRLLVALFFATVTGICLRFLRHYVDRKTSIWMLNQIGLWLGASVYGQIAIFGVVATSSVTSDLSGTSHAIAALAANIGSILAGLPFAALAEAYSWSFVFSTLVSMTGSSVILIAMNNMYT